MNEMIKQVALLADIMKRVQEDKAGARVNEKRVEEEGVSEPEEKEPSDAERKSKESLENQREAGAVEADPAEEESQAEEESIVASLMDDMACETLEEAKNEPQRKEEAGIKHRERLGALLFYLQAKTEYILEEGTEKFVPGVEREKAPAEKPPPVIDKPDEYREEEGPKPEDERSGRRAAKQSYCEQPEPWPKSLKVMKPPDPGLRPKEKRKIQGTYKNLKKKREIAGVMYSRKIR